LSQRLIFVSQWVESSDDKNARNKMKKENPPNYSFSQRGKEKAHFGLHRRCAVTAY
jgi:hypothetical protein